MDCVEREIADVLKINPILFIDLNEIVSVSVSFSFWCKETYIEELELIDLLDSLEVFCPSIFFFVSLLKDSDISLMLRIQHHQFLFFIFRYF